MVAVVVLRAGVIPRTVNYDDMQLWDWKEFRKCAWFVWAVETNWHWLSRFNKKGLPEFRFRLLLDCCCWCLHCTWVATSAKNSRKTLTILLLHISFCTRYCDMRTVAVFWHRFSFFSSLSLDTFIVDGKHTFLYSLRCFNFFLSFLCCRVYPRDLWRCLSLCLKKRKRLNWEISQIFEPCDKLLRWKDRKWTFLVRR